MIARLLRFMLAAVLTALVMANIAQARSPFPLEAGFDRLEQLTAGPAPGAIYPPAASPPPASE